MKCNKRYRTSQEIFIVRERKGRRNAYGELCEDNTWETIFYASCVTPIVKSTQGITDDIVTSLPTNEAIRQYFVVFIEMCNTKCMDLCNSDLRVGMYAYLNCIPYKIVAVRPTNDCGCLTIKLILERIEPREDTCKLITCATEEFANDVFE